MKRILFPWSKARTPGITAQVVTWEIQTADSIVAVPQSAVSELTAAFAAFCGSWQQGDRHGCAIVAPLLTKYGVAPLSLEISTQVY